MSGSRATFSPRERLRAQAQFQRVFRRGQRLDGEWFLLVAAPNDLDYSRLGLATGRRVGGAVRRNRARRLLREAFRRHRDQLPSTGFDLVIVAKAGLAHRSLIEVELEYASRLERLARRIGPRRAPAPAGN